MKMKVVGRDSYGKIPKVFIDNDIVQMEFDIHDFANLPEKIDEYFDTGTIKAHGHLWKLKVLPRGIQNFDGESVCIDLVYAGENSNTDPVVAKGSIRTKTTNREVTKYAFSKGKSAYYCRNFATRTDIIKKDCNEAGTLTITVELEVATEQRSVWYPRLTSCDYGQLYHSRTATSDVTFIIGTSRVEFLGHKCILFLRARVLYELGVTEEEESSSAYRIVLADVTSKVFEVLLLFIYTGKVPTLNSDDEELAKSILLVANRFGVTELKLYMESILVEKCLVPSNAAGLLLFADSYTCPLLKEVSMRLYASHSKEVMESTNNWTKVKESNDLLVELLMYATSSARGGGGGIKYSSIVDDGNGTVEDVDTFDVTSLRERLVKVNLDVDGSRTMLIDCWKNYLRANDDDNEEAEVVLVETEVEAEAVEVL